jgi:hypothetical protein
MTLRSLLTPRSRCFAFGCILALGAGSALAQEKPLTIENDALQASFDRGTGRFSLIAKPSQRVFLRDGKFSSVNGTARTTTGADRSFGRGQVIEISYPTGNRDSIMVFPNLPFALFRSSLHNPGTELIVTNKLRPLSAIVDLKKSAAELKTLGSGGLLAADKNPGSYVWLAVAEPLSRNGVISGWLTHERGSGVLFSSEEGGRVRLDGQIDYGRLRVAPGKMEELETLAIGYFDDARLGLEKWADAVAKVYHVKLPPQPAGYCTWYSRPYGGASDEKHLAELSVFAARQLAPFGFSVVQIDDHWQAGVSTNGPKRNFSTHAAKGPYPEGMKAAAEQIKSLGLVPGLWFMPFAGDILRSVLPGSSGLVCERRRRRAVRNEMGRHLPGHDPSRSARLSPGQYPANGRGVGLPIFQDGWPLDRHGHPSGLCQLWLPG